MAKKTPATKLAKEFVEQHGALELIKQGLKHLSKTQKEYTAVMHAGDGVFTLTVEQCVEAVVNTVKTRG